MRLGSFDTAAVDGLRVLLKDWAGMRPEPELIDQLDGAFFGRSRLAPVELKFDIEITTATPEETLAIRDELVSRLSPHLGLQPLVPEPDVDDWHWMVVASSVPDFSRGLWVRGMQCTLTGELTMVAPEGYARRQEVAVSGAAIEVLGNLPAHPRIEVAGPFSSTTITGPGGYSVTVDMAVPAGSRLVLDHSTRDYGVWQGNTKTAHAAQAMSNVDRLALAPGATRQITASAGALTVVANSRKG